MLKEAIKIAQQFPTTPQAKALKDAILNGKMDVIAVQEGVDLAALKTKAGVKPSGIIATTLQPLVSSAMKSGEKEAAIEKVGESSPMVGNVLGMTKSAVQGQKQAQAEEAFTQTPQGQKQAEEAAHPISTLMTKGQEALGEVPYVGGILETGAKALGYFPKTITKGLEASTGQVIESGKKIGTAAQNLVDFLSFAPGTEKKGVEALQNIIEGSLGAITSPVAGITDMAGELPLIGDYAKKGVEGVGKIITPSTYGDLIIDKVMESKGLQPGTPEYTRFEEEWKRPLGNALNTLGALFAPTAVKGAKNAITKTWEKISTKAGEVKQSVKESLSPGMELEAPKYKPEIISPQTIKGLAEKEVPVPKKIPAPPIDVTPLVEKAKQSQGEFNKAIQAEYETSMEPIIEANKGKKFPEVLTETKDNVISLLQKFKIGKKPINKGGGLDFSKTPIPRKAPGGPALLQEMVDIIYSAKNTGVEGLKLLMQNLNPSVKNAKKMSADVYSIASQIYDTANTAFGNKIPAVKALNKWYSESSTALKKAKKITSTGESSLLNIEGKGKVESQKTLEDFAQKAKELGIDADVLGPVKKIMEEARQFESNQSLIRSQAKTKQAFMKEKIRQVSEEVNMNVNEFNDMIRGVIKRDPGLTRKFLNLVWNKKKSTLGVLGILGATYLTGTAISSD